MQQLALFNDAPAGPWAMPVQLPVGNPARIGRELQAIEAALDAGQRVDFVQFDLLCGLWANGRYAAQYRDSKAVAAYDRIKPLYDRVMQRVLDAEGVLEERR